MVIRDDIKACFSQYLEPSSLFQILQSTIIGELCKVSSRGMSRDSEPHEQYQGEGKILVAYAFKKILSGKSAERYFSTA
jgi:hypothetical protein